MNKVLSFLFVFISFISNGQNCERLYEGFGKYIPPYTHKKIFVRFHIIRDDNGQKNFTEAEGQPYIQNLIASCNSIMQGNVPIYPFYNSGFPFYDNVPPPVVDINMSVEIKPKLNDPLDPEVDGIYFYNNTNAWCASSPTDIDDFIEEIIEDNPGVTNVFLTEDCCLWDGAVKHCAGSGIALPHLKSVMLYSAYKNNLSPYSLGLVLNHEIYHIFQLAHTFEEDGCDDTPMTSKNWCGPNHSNNVMDYNCAHVALSPLQILKMHNGTGNYVQNGYAEDLCTGVSYPAPPVSQNQNGDYLMVNSTNLANTEIVWQLLADNQVIFQKGNQASFHRGLYQGTNLTVAAFMIDDNGCRGTKNYVNLSFPAINSTCNEEIDLTIQYNAEGNPIGITSQTPNTFWTYSSLNGLVDFTCNQNQLDFTLNNAPRLGDVIYVCASALVNNGTCWINTCETLMVETDCPLSNSFDNTYTVLVREKVVGNNTSFIHRFDANAVLPSRFMHAWIFENTLYGTKTTKLGNHAEFEDAQAYSKSIKLCKTIYDLHNHCFMPITECVMLEELKSEDCDSYNILSFENDNNWIFFNPNTNTITYEMDMGDPIFIPGSVFTFFINKKEVQPTTLSQVFTTYTATFQIDNISCGDVFFEAFYEFTYVSDDGLTDCTVLYANNTYHIGADPCPIIKKDPSEPIASRSGLQIISVSPNPIINGEVRYEINSTDNSPVNVKITDVYGVEYYNTTKSMSAGQQDDYFSPNTLASGIYILSVSNQHGFDSKIFTVE